MHICPLCGKPIIADLQAQVVLEGFECEGGDKFFVHDLPCAEGIRKALKKLKTEKGKQNFMLKLLKKISE